MKTCEKCGTQFPTRIVVAGKDRNLQRRRFCLECSPFGNHNTKDFTDPHKAACDICGNVTDNRSTCRSCWQKIRRYRAKAAGIQYLGGKCSHCGFTGHQAAFDFHHVDPASKSFNIGINLQKSWQTIKRELDKCVLLCRNCHSILHCTREDPTFLTFATRYSGKIEEFKHAGLAQLAEHHICNMDVIGSTPIPGPIQG
jgi:hypothetical protein